jgi:membrane-bound ClpP family serine protease
MDAQFWALALAILGFGLIVAEFFVPSGGMIALSCAGAFVGSVVCAHAAWYEHSPKVFWSFSLGLGVLIPSFLVFFLRTLEQTSLGKNILLPKTDPDDVVPYKSEAAALERLIGRVGTTLTPMNPGGMVRVENERLHATTEGMLLSLGDPVEVIAIQGNRVIVRRASSGKLASASPLARVSDAATSSPASPAEPERLDFDVPQD